MSYVVNSDFTAADSVWYVTRVEISPEEKRLYARIDGWSSQDSKDAGESPIANKSYSVQGDDYDAYFAESILDDADTTTITQIFAYGDAALDTGGDSFFADATPI